MVHVIGSIGSQDVLLVSSSCVDDELKTERRRKEPRDSFLSTVQPLSLTPSADIGLRPALNGYNLRSKVCENGTSEDYPRLVVWQNYVKVAVSVPWTKGWKRI